MAASHRIEPELDQPLPRRSVVWPRLRLAHVGLTLFGIPFVLVGIVVAFLALQSTATQLVGEPVRGEVLNKVEGTDSEGDTTYSLMVGYSANGSTQQGKVSVSRARYSAVSEGGTVALRYLDFPRSHVALDGDYKAPLFFIVFASIWDVVVIAMIWALVNQVKRSLALLRRGTAAVAKITEKTVDEGSDSTTHYLHYRFQADGQTIFGKDSVSASRWKSAQVDEQFTALYLPEAPDTCALFKFI